MTVLITLTTAGADSGPFNLYSDVDGYTSAFETGVSKASLLAGYLSALVPDGTGIIRVMSNSALCNNYVDISIITPSTTTSTTTTIAPICHTFTLNGGSSEGGSTFKVVLCGNNYSTGYSVAVGDAINVCAVSAILTSGEGSIIIGLVCTTITTTTALP
jgi:hypothetical protein